MPESQTSNETHLTLLKEVERLALEGRNQKQIAEVLGFKTTFTLNNRLVKASQKTGKPIPSLKQSLKERAGQKSRRGKFNGFLFPHRLSGFRGCPHIFDPVENSNPPRSGGRFFIGKLPVLDRGKMEEESLHPSNRLTRGFWIGQNYVSI